MKISHSKKGLSLIVSVLLISLISVLSSITIFFWAKNCIDTNIMKINEQSQLGQIDICNIILKSGTNDTIILDIRNIGEITVTLDTVYINDINTVISGTSNITVGTAITVEAKANSTLKSSETYAIKAVCTNGCSSTKSWSPT